MQPKKMKNFWTRIQIQIILNLLFAHSLIECKGSSLWNKLPRGVYRLSFF